MEFKPNLYFFIPHLILIYGCAAIDMPILKPYYGFKGNVPAYRYSGGKLMPTYISLMKVTDQGAKKAASAQMDEIMGCITRDGGR